jgi:hypothetical protein
MWRVASGSRSMWAFGEPKAVPNIPLLFFRFLFVRSYGFILLEMRESVKSLQYHSWKYDCTVKAMHGA